ncbi:MAG: hypothetical protein JOZ73_09550 [Solirubrobacterales bacterium]|nr:hypothetical protein [Solirubrobacterales bacterium]
MSSTTTIVVPKLKCAAVNRAIVAGTGIFTSAKQTAAELFVGCIGGRPRYFPVLIVNGTKRTYTALSVRQGDTIVLKAADSARGATVSLTDETQKRIKRSVTGRGSSQVGGPWMGDQAWSYSGKTEHVPNFGTLGYSNTTVNGHLFGSFRRLGRFNRVTTHGSLQIETGPVGRNGESFTTFFKHA